MAICEIGQFVDCYKIDLINILLRIAENLQDNEEDSTTVTEKAF